MPTYRVLKPGFINNTLYKEDELITLPKAFTKKNHPSWLERVEDPAPEDTEAEERAAADAAEKAKQDKIEKDAVTFTEDPKSTGPAVETLK